MHKYNGNDMYIRGHIWGGSMAGSLFSTFSVFSVFSGSSLKFEV